MKTVQAKYDDRRLILLIFSFVIIPIGLFLSYVGFSEYYTIAILGEGDKYPFGLINENPWFYETPEIYARYQLSTGIIFILFSLAAIIAVFKKTNKWTLIFNLVLVLLTVSVFFSF